MKKPQLKYIELKTGYEHNGPAWIAYVEFSKSGKTIYFNGMALHGNGHGICSDIVSRDIYWISGIKKNGEDRHWLGKGGIQIDKKAIDEYLTVAGLQMLDPKKYTVVDIQPTDKSKFIDIENSKLYSEKKIDKYDDLVGLTKPELERVILELENKESRTNPNNGLKFYSIKKQEAKKLLKNLMENELK
ncbi:MAG: hypothetical protein Q8J69_09480 [Sphingobacteriaceae bacterium]|nr:hypothetical protein [Sphingobacteriaceae bacterium]